MPYFITDKAEGCDGFATIKEDGTVIGCHQDKQSAIDQMIAVSIAEDIEPGGERKKIKKKKMKKSMYRALPDHYRPALTEDVPEGRACGNCFFYNEQKVNEDGTKAYCENWKEFVDGGFYCNAWRMDEEMRAPVPGADKFTTEKEALDRAKEIGCSGTHSMDENGETIFMPCSTHSAYDKIMKGPDSSDGGGAYRIEPAPAAKKDQITGSKKNKPGSAKGAGGAITFDAKTTTALQNKVSDHNESMTKANKPRHTRTTLGQLKAVYRRGSGAFSSSNRPGISRGAWSMARVNAFLYLLRNGRPANPAYKQDNDLLPSGHPKSTRTLDMENREVNLSPPTYMRAAARRGLEFNRQGKGGSGLTDKTKAEAREMAEGSVSEDKWIRTAPWIARHLVDLDAPDAKPTSENYPSAGVVAHLLWGSGPSKTAAMRTMKYAEGVVERIKAEEDRKRWSTVGLNLQKEEQPMNQIERRIKNDIDFELRVEPDASDGMIFEGYAAVFDSDSEPLPFTERINVGAFAKTLKSRNEVKLFMNHNMDHVLASTRSKTLSLTEDSKGLMARATLPDTSAGRDLAVLMKRGDVHSMSFGFSVPKGGEKWSGDGAIRELREIRLHEVSIVTGFPAYKSTTAAVRSLDILSQRTDIDADHLADLMLKLEAGETLVDDDATVLTEVINKLRENNTEMQDHIENLDLKRKELDLLMKAI